MVQFRGSAPFLKEQWCDGRWLSSFAAGQGEDREASLRSSWCSIPKRY